MRFVQNEPFHATQPMEGGVCAGHDGGVGWQREWGLRRRMSKHDPPGGKRVVVWCLRSLVAAASGRWSGITTQVVGTCGVERNQDDVGVPWQWGRGACGF